MASDSQLLAQYAWNRSEAAFAELVRRRAGLVYGIAFSITRDRSAAEDVTQGIFISLARKAHALASHPALVAWLYRSAQYAAYDALRKMQRRERKQAEALQMQMTAGDERMPDWEEMGGDLSAAVSTLSSADGYAVLLRFIEGLSFAEVGARLGLSENAARMRVERALDRIRQALQRRGIHSTAAALALGLEAQASVSAPIGLAPALLAASAAAPVGVAAAAAGSLLGFMTATKWMGLAALGAAAVLGSAWYEMRRADRAEREVAALHRIALENERLRAEVVDLRRQPSAARTPVAAAWRPAMPASGLSPLQRNALQASVAATAIDPEKLARQRKRLAPFIAARGLSPEQGERLAQILAGWDAISRDFQESTRAQGLVDSSEVWKLRGQLQEANETQPLKDLLGPAGERAYFDFERQDFYFSPLTTVAAQLDASHMPLSDEQRTALLAVMKASFEKVPKTDPTQLGTELRVNWSKVVDGAGQVLSPPQWAILRGYAAGQGESQ